MKVAVSGHRPQSLGQGWNDHKFHNAVKKALWDYLDIVQPDLLISGMALGVDQWAAEWCIKNVKPYIAAMPFKTMDSKWSPKSKADHKYFLHHAELVVLVDREPGYIDAKVAPDIYRTEKMHTRNRWMVDQLNGNDQLVVVIDHNKGHSGTHNCLAYAEEKKKYVVEIPVEQIDGYQSPYGLKDDDVPF